MESISLLKTALICGTVIIIATIILASLPRSRLRTVIAKILRFIFALISIVALIITGIAILYIVNPVDILPDFIPVLGQVDDAAAVIVAIFSVPTAIFSGVVSIACGYLGRSGRMAGSGRNIQQLPLVPPQRGKSRKMRT